MLHRFFAMIAAASLLWTSHAAPLAGQGPPRNAIKDSEPRMPEDADAGRERRIPDYSIVTADKKRLSPAALEGKVVMYDFWATWCPPCVAAVPSLKKLQQKYSGAPFLIVSISADENAFLWRRFTTTERMVWPQFWDDKGEMRRKFEINTIPTYILVDAQGMELRRVTGDGFYRLQGFQAEIDDELAKLKLSPAAR